MARVHDVRAGDPPMIGAEPRRRPGRTARDVYVIGNVAFVPHPIYRGLWIRTDTSVVKVACTMCKSPKNVPCSSTRNEDTTFNSATHYVRRGDARRIKFPEGDETRITVRQR